MVRCFHKQSSLLQYCSKKKLEVLATTYITNALDYSSVLIKKTECKYLVICFHKRTSLPQRCCEKKVDVLAGLFATNALAYSSVLVKRECKC